MKIIFIRHIIIQVPIAECSLRDRINVCKAFQYRVIPGSNKKSLISVWFMKKSLVFSLSPEKQNHDYKIFFWCLFWIPSCGHEHHSSYHSWFLLYARGVLQRLLQTSKKTNWSKICGTAANNLRIMTLHTPILKLHR